MSEGIAKLATLRARLVTARAEQEAEQAGQWAALLDALTSAEGAFARGDHDGAVAALQLAADAEFELLGDCDHVAEILDPLTDDVPRGIPPR